MKMQAAKKISAIFALLPIVLIYGYLAATSGALMFVVYAVVCIYFPGRLVIGKCRNLSPSLRFLLGFYAGMAVSILMYYLCCLIHTFLPLQIILPMLGSAYIVMWIKAQTGTDIKKSIDKMVRKVADNHLVIWCIAAAMVYSFYLLNVRYSTPSTVWNPDFQWHMGNIYTLAGSFDFSDIRVEGMTFTYHYFCDLFYAIGRIIFGFKPFICVMRFPTLITPLLVLSSVSALFENIPIKNVNTRYIAAFAVMMFTPLYGANNDLSYQWLTKINSVAFALPCGVAVVCLIIRIAR
ncbi:MAG: hypothetical protein RR009_08495, partial [Oscillospiraceae bacterium]